MKNQKGLVGVQGGMMSVSFRSLSKDLKPLAVSGGVMCLLFLSSADGGIKLKEERFEYPNQLVRKYPNLLTAAYTKGSELMDQIVFTNGKPGGQQRILLREGEGGQLLISKIDKSIKNKDISWEN